MCLWLPADIATNLALVTEVSLNLVLVTEVTGTSQAEMLLPTPEGDRNDGSQPC